MRHKSELRPYQNDTIAYLYERDEAICVIRPGGGKTVSALTAIRELIDDGAIRHALVIAPKRVATEVWPAEIAEWAHTAGLRYAVLDGGPKERQEKLLKGYTRDITIIGIDNLQWLCGALASWDEASPIFDLLVIDEVSRLRNPTGKRAQSLAKIASRWKMIWGLTGTLRPSGPLDLFMPARVVTRGRLWGRSFYKWRQQHFYASDYMGYNWKPLSGTEDRLNAEIAPLVFAPELPPQPVAQIVLDRVRLPPEARRRYDDMEEKLVTGDVVAASSGVATGKLAQLANGFIYDNEGVTRRVHDAKVEWLQEIIEGAAGPTLLVYEFIEDLHVMRELLGAGLPYLGQGVTDAQSSHNIAEWNAGRLPFLALHPASGGHGLNLQHGGADMAWLSPTWSPEMWEQTIARLNRSGQTKPVIVRVCVAADTVDQLKLNRVHLKMSAQEAFEDYLRRWRKAA